MKIFLDFDGVLHPDAVFRPRNKPLELRAPGALFMHAQILVDILDEWPKTEIILSTSWVNALGYERTLKKIPVDLKSRVTGATWHKSMRHGANDPFSWMTRWQQIEWYVKRHGVEHWLAIDDLHSGDEIDKWPAEQRHRLVLTDPNLGLGCPVAQEDLRAKLRSLK